MASLSGRRLCPGCMQVITGRCQTCRPAQRAQVDQQRGNSNSRGYDSHWRRVTRPAFLRDNPLCVICGALAHVPDHWPETRASLVARGATDPDAAHRLRALCVTCHNIHGLSDKPWSQHQVNTRVTLVAGPPCAGKNTYVTEHAQPDDVVIDYDEIMSELSGLPTHHHDEVHTAQAVAIQTQRISQLLASGGNGWVIATAAQASVRHQYRTNVVVLIPTQAEAIERARAERPDGWETYVRQWYQRYQPDARDTVISA